ncbi:ALI_HP2_G0028780.mRNA.1.CDS.1 [Saccharomyces cerevisiae]|nr:ALI_HP2_G0028780.mRNA.1.CDS.1 [Saccharomyces cerevisiae]CAI6641518.1 ALI_HP1_G0034960.mRNA.1.CDS.1 [Saccharomyces cerevisiae]CAI6702917.1 ALI_HP2_G0028780.mRNA.1.CDS.1 [Saccharomyces cerevisiae]
MRCFWIVQKSIFKARFFACRNFVKKHNYKLISTMTGSTEMVPPTMKHTVDNKRLSSPLTDSGNRRTKKPKLRKYKAKKVETTSPMGVLEFEVNDLLKSQNLSREQVLNDVNSILNDKSSTDGPIVLQYHREVKNVKVLEITSNGNGLALIDNPVETEKKQVVIIPFGLSGDVVNIKVFKTHPYYVESDLLDVVEKSPMRRDDLIRDKYFGKSSGSQLEFLTYDDQLELKRKTIMNAYKFFAPRLVAEKLLPPFDTTVASPLRFGYRTKITPHFDMPKRKQKELSVRPPLGFGQKGRPQWRKDTLDIGGHGSILDIDECVLATEALNKGLTNERRKFEQEFKNYKKGATILLRENTTILDPSKPTLEQLTEEASRDENGDISYVEVEDKKNNVRLAKTCVTNPRQIVTEYVDGYTFNFSAGEFFQNNNSILPIVTKYVRDNLQAPAKGDDNKTKFLVDAYCGSGLFSICSSKGVDKVIGVEISADSVSFAEKNAKANGVENCRFIVGKAEKLFESIDTPSENTSVILDPPRKGCDELFLKQLAAYNPAKIIYISCNVHSQARDVEYFLKETENGSAYQIESIRGFDFFPQTHHVESVCIMKRI